MSKTTSRIWVRCGLGILGAALAATTFAQSGSTDFMQWDRNYRAMGDWTAQQFTVTASSLRLRIRAVSDLKADFVVFPASQLARFQRNLSVTGWGLDDQFGLQTVTLPRGVYYLGTRNQARTWNRVRVELDFLLNVPGWRFHSWGIADAGYVPSDGGWWYEEFFLNTPTLRNFMDGTTTGIETYILPASQIDRFIDGDSFYYYPSYSGTNPSLPGLYELTLPRGWYALAFWNSNWKERPVAYDVERWVRSTVRSVPPASKGTALAVGSPFGTSSAVVPNQTFDAGAWVRSLSAKPTLARHPGLPTRSRASNAAALRSVSPHRAGVALSAKDAPLRTIGAN